MNSQLDDSKESVQSQSMERYLQAESVGNSLSPQRQVQTSRNTQVGASILKLQNGKYSNQQNVFKEALNKKMTELHKKQQKPIVEAPKYQIEIKQKQPKKMDKVQQNIKNVQLKAEEVKKKKEEEKQKEEKMKQSKVEHAQEDLDEVFQETVNRLYNYEKQRLKQLNKMIEDEKNKDKLIMTARPMINERSCKLLERKLKQLVNEEEDYKMIYQFKDADVQVDLLPGLPKLKDYLSINVKKTINLGQEIQIIKEENIMEPIDPAEDVQYKEGSCHAIVQTNEIKFKIGDTIKKQQQQQQPQQQQQITQFATQDTPNKKVQNQRQKRLDFMEAQGQRVKTECQYYVPLHIRQQKIIQKKEEWMKSQIELKKQKEEESIRAEQEQWEKEKLKWSKRKDPNKSMQQEINVEEFANSQIHWLEKRNEHILTEQIKKDKDMLSSLTFRPQIQKRNIENYNTTKVEDRLLDYQQKKQENLQKLENKYLPTFQPNINQKTVLNMDWASKSFNNTSSNKLWQ
ncbi:unnamed protein product (macronuclear) [Paramecium tetraurelia]|uniref:Uncharacterized protein n=1 Tax=Paramecium tetraurelia TaxID=5888 RepID=A0EDT6_PARTE|nr:uncharacterized protein GSPATT00025797001 [Paramecium tetraurelia]CAK93453.1 unnamed protein product [Paramecium tetraurelia]|eukprot:XP_001460850.1 hypothetical protein (macronuclear) [Paramecium tetraurelia strain d4-2]